MTKLNNARPQARPAARTDQCDRAERLRDAAGRFAKTAKHPTTDAEKPAAMAAQEAPPSGTIPAPADAPDDAYGLSVNDNSLGLHAAPGSAIVVAPTMPTGAGLAVFYLKGRSGSVVFDLTHAFRPERAAPFAPGSELVPLIEVVVPGTGETGRLRADLIEKIHRVVGVYTPVDVAENAPTLPPKLLVMGECPEGMGELYVGDAGAYPMVRKGETIVFDPARREPTHGALCVMQWTNGTRDVMLTNRRTVGSKGRPYWWVNPVNRAANHEALERRHSSGPAGIIYASDGPFDTNHLREKIVGTVVGVLVPSRRATEAWR